MLDRSFVGTPLWNTARLAVVVILLAAAIGTTAIFGELQTQFSPAVASSLSLVLVALSLLVLAGESGFHEHGRLQRSGPLPNPPER